MKNKEQRAITMVGLGSMGKTIAKLYLQQGYKVTVWNRTASRSSELVGSGADAAADLAAAVKASELVIVCVFNYEASDQVLNRPELVTLLKGKTIVQLTTGSSAEARDSYSWLQKAGANYLDGAIQVAPEQMALPDTTILLSGDENIYQKFKPDLEVLGGNLTFLGNDIELANTMDLATLSYVYGSALGFFQGALIAEAARLDLRLYGKIISEMAPNFGVFFQHEANMIAENNFEITQSPLNISIAAVKRIEQATKEAGLDTRIPSFITKFFEEAEEKGWGDKEAAVLIKLLRSR